MKRKRYRVKPETSNGEPYESTSALDIVAYAQRLATYTVRGVVIVQRMNSPGEWSDYWNIHPH